MPGPPATAASPHRQTRFQHVLLGPKAANLELGNLVLLTRTWGSPLSAYTVEMHTVCAAGPQPGGSVLLRAWMSKLAVKAPMDASAQVLECSMAMTTCKQANGGALMLKCW
jgi:hypothetical protein